MELQLGILVNQVLPRHWFSAATRDRTMQRGSIAGTATICRPGVSKRNQLPASTAINQCFTI
jgi:hypothetical protein